MVSKPIFSVYPDEYSQWEFSLAFNLRTENLDNHSHAVIVHKVVEKIWSDQNAAATVASLHAGDDTERLPEFYSERSASTSLNHPLRTFSDIDVGRVEAVCTHNTFAFTPLQFYEQPRTGVEAPEKGAALYALPSLINHGCLATAAWTTFGDAIVVRATADLHAGDEVTVQYTSGLHNLETREADLAKRGFSCKCAMCAAERKVGARVLARREELISSISQDARRGAFKDVDDAFNALEMSYDTVRDLVQGPCCGIMPALPRAHTAVARAVLVSGDKPRYLERYFRHEMLSLESVGLVILDKSTTGPMRNKGRAGPATYAKLPIEPGRVPRYFGVDSVAIMLKLSGIFRDARDTERAIAWMRAAAHGEL